MDQRMQEILHEMEKRRGAWVDDLLRYVRIPSVSGKPEQKQAMRQAADYTCELLHKAGLSSAKVHETAGHPVVVARHVVSPDAAADGQEIPTILIYGHYDVQPEEPLALWHHPPFNPWIDDDRLFGRGSADDKGQVLMHIKALESIVAALGELPLNVVLMVEGEEEIGSPNLPPFIEENLDLLKADLAVVSDSFMWDEGLPAITLGIRGMAVMEVTLTGPARDLHSGSYGGAVANPNEVLARLLASVKDDDGRILIPGFYDEVRELSHAEQALMAQVPFDEEKWLKDLNIKTGWGEAGRSTLERLWSRPTFEINGIWGGYTGEGMKTVLPSQAHAKITLRLVPDQDPVVMAQRVKDYLIDQAPDSVTVDVTIAPGGGPATLTPHDLPEVALMRKALKGAFSVDPVIVRDGISIPIVADFKRLLGVDTVLAGFCLPDARIHSPNENIHLPTFFSGIKALINFYMSLALRR